MSRAWSVYAAFLLLLISMAFFAWLSRAPEAAFFDRAERWAVIGAWIGHVRDLYRPPVHGAEGVLTRRSTGSRPGGEATDPGDLVIEVERVWIGIGAALREAPDPQARRMELTQSLRNYSIVDRREQWLEVERADGSTVWYDPDAPRDRTPPLGMAPSPVLPVPARPADPVRLAMARATLGGALRALEMHGYRLLTDVRSESLLRELGSRLATVEASYRRRYGVEPIGEPAETVVLFEREDSYRRFESQVLGADDQATVGHASRGVVALFVGGRRAEETAATLVHEVGHLLNRRALGPALPKWLDEGLAEDLAHFAELEPTDSGRDAYRGQRIEQGEGRSLLLGNLGALAQLRAAHAAGDLPSLEQLAGGGPDPFSGSISESLLYSQAGFWLRSLVARRNAALQALLRSIAAGGPATGERLLHHLEADWAELDRELERYLESEAVVAGLDASDG